jgi:hypothetical protein
MGYAVRVVVEFRKVPHEHEMDALNHVFGVAEHVTGSKSVTLVEHVGVSDQADAIAFVRSLVDDAIPEGTKVVSIDATPEY